MVELLKKDRRHAFGSDSHDQRDSFQRDRDRILYCSAFRRLAGVTQVVGAAEGHLFHNRLTHSMKVAQIARRVSEFLLTQAAQKGAADLPLSADVAEAAALAHDLGHPPFGHAGEHALNSALQSVLGDLSAGYEGNAQSFRIVTTLALRHHDSDGLNLTRGTLSAILKYPCVFDAEKTKYGAYPSEQADFDFARAMAASTAPSLEATVMDWADDIAYAIHDLEDFYRANLVPLNDFQNEDFRAQFLRQTEMHWRTKDLDFARAEFLTTELAELIPPQLNRPYAGESDQRRYLRGFTSRLVGRYVQAAEYVEDDPNGKRIRMRPQELQELKILKLLMRHYVFGRPALVAQQYGQQRIVKELFEDLLEAAKSVRLHAILPASCRESLGRSNVGIDLRARTAADVIASMTETQAYALHARLRGFAPGTVRDSILL